MSDLNKIAQEALDTEAENDGYTRGHFGMFVVPPPVVPPYAFRAIKSCHPRGVYPMCGAASENAG